MSDYVPSTEDVRDKYIGQGFVDGEFKEYTDFARERIGAEFDRWLAEVEQAAAARALEEAADDHDQALGGETYGGAYLRARAEAYRQERGEHETNARCADRRARRH